MQFPAVLTEITTDYVVLCTGYTDRLVKAFTDPKKRALDANAKICVVYIKDDLACPSAKLPATNNAESKKIKDMLDKIKVDGVVVIRLADHESPFYALKCFHNEYGSGKDGRYCACFDGIPYTVSAFQDEGLGSVMVMEFDTESG